MRDSSKLAVFVESLPSRPTSELLGLLFSNDAPHVNRTLYALTADGSGDLRAMQEAYAEIRAEINRRIPPSQVAE